METRDIIGKEVLATGTFHGQGSAPDGDTYTTDDLDGIVEAAGILSLKRPFKLGHNAEQQLVAKDGWPAVGWVENLRRVGDKLLADIKSVPAKIADLIDVGAYRTLSPELIWNYQDGDGDTYDRVLTGLALLGADIPAVTSLDDFVSLYGFRKADLKRYQASEPDGEIHTYELEEHDYIIRHEGDEWVLYDKDGEKVLGTFDTEAEAKERERQIIAAVEAKKHAGQTEEDIDPSETDYEDITEDPDILARFASMRDEMEELIHGKTGAPRLRVWVREAHRDLSTILEKAAAKKVMGEEQVSSDAAPITTEQGDEQVKKEICLALGIPEDTPDDEVVAKIAELQAKPTIDLKAYMALDSEEHKSMQAELETGREATKELSVIKRNGVLDPAEKDGKFLPADRESWEKRYEALGHEETVKMLSELAPVVELGERGQGGKVSDLSDRETLDAETKAYRAQHPELSYTDALKIVSAQQ